MARWRLIEPHYLYTKDPTKWEYMETDRSTLRQKRVQYEVPRYIHHEDATEWTHRDGDTGYVVVSDGNNAEPRDIIFRGDPTPGMLALDKEAYAISERFSATWKQPTTLLNPNEPDWAGRHMDAYVEKQDKINIEKSAQQSSVSNEFMQILTNIMKQNQEILLATHAKSLGIKPIEDNLEPLPEVEEPKRRRM